MTVDILDPTTSTANVTEALFFENVFENASTDKTHLAQTIQILRFRDIGMTITCLNPEKYDNAFIIINLTIRERSGKNRGMFGITEDFVHAYIRCAACVVAVMIHNIERRVYAILPNTLFSLSVFKIHFRIPS